MTIAVPRGWRTMPVDVRARLHGSSRDTTSRCRDVTPVAAPAPPGRPSFAPPPGTPYGGPPLDAEWVPPPGSVYGGGPDALAGARRKGRDGAWPPKALPVPGAPDEPADKGSRAVALLLAVAAVLAAIITARASLIASDATSDWQASVAAEQKRGEMLLQDTRYTYGVEGEQAFLIATQDLTAQELRRVQPVASPDVARRLDQEAQVQEQLMAALAPSMELVANGTYKLPSGGYDLQRRLADRRATDPDTLALDPAADIVAGDAAADHALRLMVVTVLIGVAFLCGALAQAHKRRRRLLLTSGWLFLGASAAVALALELAA
jgi:hypothetical protein